MPGVHAEERVADHEVHQLRDAFYLVLPVPASSALLVEAPPVSTSHCWRMTAFSDFDHWLYDSET